MKKVIVNEHTEKLTQNQVILSFKETYLNIQKCLLNFLDRETNPDKKEEIKGKIKEIGETHKKVMKELKKEKVKSL